MKATQIRTAVVGALVACLAGFGAPPAANAHAEPLIQPGAELWGQHGALDGTCTMNFVFRDANHTYIGAGARCVRLGERAVTAKQEFGTVVFYVGAFDTPANDEFALIRVDASEVHRVSPVVLGTNFAPTGVKNSAQTNPGDVMYMTGQGVGYRQTSTQHRTGVHVVDDDRKFQVAIPASLGDGGAPVLDQFYNAYGMLNSSVNPNVGAPYGITVERILQLLAAAGWDVELVTGSAAV